MKLKHDTIRELNEMFNQKDENEIQHTLSDYWASLLDHSWFRIFFSNSRSEIE